MAMEMAATGGAAPKKIAMCRYIVFTAFTVSVVGATVNKRLLKNV